MVESFYFELIFKLVESFIAWVKAGLDSGENQSYDHRIHSKDRRSRHRSA